MNLFRITTIRLSEKEGREALEKFIFGGHYGPSRVPRGIDPRVVSNFLKEKFKRDTEAEEFFKALEVMRFYESVDAVDHFRGMLADRVVDQESFRKHIAICQIMGDIGGPSRAEEAATHFNRNLLPHAESLSTPSLMLDTLLILAPADTVQPFQARVEAEIARLAPDQRKSEKAMMAFDRMAALERSEIPRIQRLIDFKTKLSVTPSPERRHLLVKLYLGSADISDPYLQVWGARLLRFEAMEIGPEPVRPEFIKVLDNAPDELIGKNAPTDIIFTRAARALQYFLGVMNEVQFDKWTRKKTAGLDFLDDSDG